MKKWGIVLIVVGIVIILGSLGMAEGFQEDKPLIDNISRMEVVISAGTVNPDAAESEAGYEGRLSIHVHYFIAGGAVIAALGLFMFLAGREAALIYKKYLIYSSIANNKDLFRRKNEPPPIVVVSL